MAGRRHHYTPRFLLRRFAERSGRREGLVWRLDKRTGQPRPVAPKYEAALPHYYRLVQDDGTTDSRPEDILACVESAAASALLRVERGEVPTDEERTWLALFVFFQHRRTPVGREWLKYLDELVAEMTTGVSLSNAEEFHRRASAVDANMSPEEIDELRLELLDDLESGRLKLRSTPSREIACMFIAAERVAEQLVMGFSWAALRAPGDVDLVLPGMGITLYDPTPPFLESGLGFASSPNVETILPIDPTFAIALTPGPPSWNDVEIGADDVEEINLRAYAWSDACFYGPSQKVVTDLRASARRQRTRVAKFMPRPGRIWLAESVDGPKSGEFEFVGHSPSGSSRRRFVVEPGAFDDAEPFRG
jgi:hypothetical protein